MAKNLLTAILTAAALGGPSKYENGGVVQKLLELARAKGSEMPQPTASIYDEGYSLPETDVGLEEPLAPSVFIPDELDERFRHNENPEDMPGKEFNKWLSSGIEIGDDKILAPDLLSYIKDSAMLREKQDKAMKRQKTWDYISPLVALAGLYGLTKIPSNPNRPLTLKGKERIKDYQEGDVVKDDDPLQIDMRMADPSIYNRSVISGKFGDERGIPDAWMQPATEPMPTPEQEAKFLEELNKIKIQQLIEKLKEEQIFNPTEIGGNMDGTSLKQAIIKEKTNSSGEKWSNFLQTLPYIENNQSLQFPPSILNRPPLPK